MILKFRTQFDRKRVFTCNGDRFIDTYKPQYSDSGSLDLVKDGKVDVFEEIQSYRESCDLKTLLSRYAAGDVSALNQRLPYFGDFSEMPKSLAGFLQLLADAENSFAQLPADIRANFNNSPSEFFASIGTPDFDQRMGADIHGSINEPNIEPNIELESEKEVSAE